MEVRGLFGRVLGLARLDVGWSSGSAGSGSCVSTRSRARPGQVLVKSRLRLPLMSPKEKQLLTARKSEHFILGRGQLAWAGWRPPPSPSEPPP